MKQKYETIIFKGIANQLIEVINEIIADYAADNLVLTVRQLYYVLVTRNVIKNDDKEYKRLASIVNRARLAGLIDWDMIEDRTRRFRGLSRWDSAGQILRSAAHSFHMDMWQNQKTRCFCIVEKEALYGVLSRVCGKYDIPLLAARGYPSSSVLHDFVTNLVLPNRDQHINIIHLGDHDPSGIDMTRDLQERIMVFCEGKVPEISLTRVALNMDQIEEKRPPPNPAKMTDSRVGNYIAQYGNQSWELDALEPRYLENLIVEDIEQYIDSDEWQYTETYTEHFRQRLVEASKDFDGKHKD